MYKSGTKVKTSQEYFEQYGRLVIGEVVDLNGLPPIMTAVRWLHQEGNAIKDHQGQIVMMMSEDLEECIDN